MNADSGWSRARDSSRRAAAAESPALRWAVASSRLARISSRSACALGVKWSTSGSDRDARVPSASGAGPTWRARAARSLSKLSRPSQSTSPRVPSSRQRSTREPAWPLRLQSPQEPRGLSGANREYRTACTVGRRDHHADPAGVQGRRRGRAHNRIRTDAGERGAAGSESSRRAQRARGAHARPWSRGAGARVARAGHECGPRAPVAVGQPGEQSQGAGAARRGDGRPREGAAARATPPQCATAEGRLPRGVGGRAWRGAEAAPAVREALSHAKALVEADHAALAAELEEPLAAVRERHGGGRQRRVDLCLEALLGRRSIFYSQPTWMYFPELPAIEFFERADFPWLEAVEAAADQIRAELLRVLAADREGLQPYIDFPPDMPLDQFRELNRSRRWSAYFLWNQSQPHAGHIARCPVTARVLEAVPLRARIEARAPTAFFSILDANTRIPPHTGVTNTRLTVHLPLIVPPGCGFRVGATTREWLPGQAWVFDDTIQHEAWNLSDTPRAILIFDIWNPLLSAAERELVQTATEIYVRHYALPATKTL